MRIESRLADRFVRLIVPKRGYCPQVLARIFLRTSGAPRKWLGVQLQARIRRRHLVNWLTDVQKISVTDCFVATEDLPEGDIETCDGAIIVRPIEPGVILLLERDASIIEGGVARLVECLATSKAAHVAYGDALYADADGRVADHWLKPPRTDPLLVANGLLLHGLVAVRETAPGIHTLCEALREGVSLQRALADFGFQLPEHSFVHSSAPVVLCTPPEPLPVDLPPLPAFLPTASILIPTRNGWDVLSACIASLRDTDWPSDRLEIVIIDNGSDDPKTCCELAALSERGEITLLRDDGDFNFARLNNAAAKAARGDLLVLLNNDTVALERDWLKRLAAYALQPQTGAVGCKLLYPEGDVQHAGVVCGIRSGAQHVFVGIDRVARGYNHLALVDRSVSAVTAACLAVTRDVFDSVGGLREELAVAYNDVAFCLDLLAYGYSNICVLIPLFIHHESRSRGKNLNQAKRDLYRSECMRTVTFHPQFFAQDPYYSEHLSKKLDHELLAL